MVDATIVSVPTQRNSGDENEAVKAGKRMGNTTRATVPRFVREKEC
jgi:hypothetical protein